MLTHILRFYFLRAHKVKSRSPFLAFN